MKMDELLAEAHKLAGEANNRTAVLLAAILIELREARAKAENRDEEG